MLDCALGRYTCAVDLILVHDLCQHGASAQVLPKREGSVVDAVSKTEPAFRRVWSNLRTQILENEFPDDTMLPTEAEIAREYSVSRQTVRRAFQDLVAEDLVFRVPGRGTFATPSSGRYLRHFGSVEDLMALSADSQLQVLHPLTAAVDPTAAGRLRLSDDRVAKMTFLRLHHGEPFSHTTAYLPPRVRGQLGDVEELASPGTVSPVTLIGLLDHVLEAPIQDAEQSITVATASGEVSQSLALPPGTPLLRIDRMYFDSEGNPVELAISHFHPDRYSYRVRLRRNPM
jgi:GntR family transcriptional regulator